MHPDGGLPVQRVREAGVWVVVDVVREHHPDLPGMLVGDRHQHLAEWQAARQ